MTDSSPRQSMAEVSSDAVFRHSGLSAYTNAPPQIPYIPLKDNNQSESPRQLRPPGNRRGPRLFDPSSEDPHDPESFWATVGVELRGLAGSESDFAERQGKLLSAVWQVVAFAAVQAGCGLLVLYMQLMRPAALRDAALVMTALVVLGSAGVGAYGAIRHIEWALHGYFLTQVWVLAAAAAQWMRSQSFAARQAIFLSAQSHPGIHLDGAVYSLAFMVALGVVYASMFYTDLLVEVLQDCREHQDNRSLLQFAWLMHKKTLVGVQRFEDLIHAKFEELVLLGFLKPRWQPPPPGRA